MMDRREGRGHLCGRGGRDWWRQEKMDESEKGSDCMKT